MLNFVSQLATQFYILKSAILTLCPSFFIDFVYNLQAVRAISSDLAPVQTTLPDLKINAVVLGSLILIIQAANLLGLYSEFLLCKANYLKSISID